MDYAIELMENKMKEIGAPHDHGVEHVMKVFKHALLALEHSPYIDTLSLAQHQSILLAALLHEVDDRKLTTTVNYANAREILSKLDKLVFYPDLVICMIDLVSCSKNGNNSPDGTPPWMLFPRAADRIEAVGTNGTARCVEYSLRKGEPMSTPSTPISLNREEVLAFATPERFEEYIRTGKSKSVIDHHYDKLLHLNSPDLPEIRASQYLSDHAKVAQNETLDALMELIQNEKS